jgi:hypothetical protein
MLFFAFETLVNLECGLSDQEQPADDENEVAAGDLLRKNRKECDVPSSDGSAAACSRESR